MTKLTKKRLTLIGLLALAQLLMVFIAAGLAKKADPPPVPCIPRLNILCLE